MRFTKHPKSAVLFGLVAVAFVAAGILLGGGGSSRAGYAKPNTDQRSVLVEMLLVEQSADGTDPVFDDLLAVVRPEGGGRLLTAAEFDRARQIAASLASPSVLRTAALVGQHNETCTATVTRSASANARVSVTPTVLHDRVMRVSLSIAQSANGVQSDVQMAFTSRGGAAIACETFATEGGEDGPGNGSAILLIRPTLVVDKP